MEILWHKQRKVFTLEWKVTCIIAYLKLQIILTVPWVSRGNTDLTIRPRDQAEHSQKNNKPSTASIQIMNKPQKEDKFDNFIRHSEFVKVLELSGKLKEQKAKLVTFTRGKHQGRQRCATSPSLLMCLRKKKKVESSGESTVRTAFSTGHEDLLQGCGT